MHATTRVSAFPLIHFSASRWALSVSVENTRWSCRNYTRRVDSLLKDCWLRRGEARHVRLVRCCWVLACAIASKGCPCFHRSRQDTSSSSSFEWGFPSSFEWKWRVDRQARLSSDSQVEKVSSCNCLWNSRPSSCSASTRTASRAVSKDHLLMRKMRFTFLMANRWAELSSYSYYCPLREGWYCYNCWSRGRSESESSLCG